MMGGGFLKKLAGPELEQAAQQMQAENQRLNQNLENIFDNLEAIKDAMNTNFVAISERLEKLEQKND